MSSNIDNDFLYWLAGLIDGDGSLLVFKNKALTSILWTVISHVKALFNIKAKYYGSVLKRSNVKAEGWRVSKRWIIEKLYNELNRILITNS